MSRMLVVAEYFKTSPADVARWPITMFDDAEEYMLIQTDGD